MVEESETEFALNTASRVKQRIRDGILVYLCKGCVREPHGRQQRGDNFAHESLFRQFDFIFLYFAMTVRLSIPFLFDVEDPDDEVLILKSDPAQRMRGIVFRHQKRDAKNRLHFRFSGKKTIKFPDRNRMKTILRQVQSDVFSRLLQDIGML